MRRTARLYAALSCALLALPAILPSCTTTVTGPTLIAGRYSYSAYDAADSLSVVGTIILRTPGDSTLTGSWDLRGVRTAGGAVGPQTGLGALVGTSGAEIVLNLNPGTADDNVMLSGSYDGRGIEGTWRWITFAGVSAEGRFTMTR